MNEHDIQMTNQSSGKHSVLSNILYALNNIWKWDKGFYFYSLPLIFLSVGINFLDVYFPKLLIDQVEKNSTIYKSVSIIGIYSSIILLLMLIRLLCNSKLAARKYSISYRYQNEISRKYMNTDFSNTDSVENNIKYQNAMNDSKGQNSPEVIWQQLLDLVKVLLGTITYGTIIFTLSPCILILLFLSAVIIYLIGRWQRNYSEKIKDCVSSLDRKLGYLSNLSSNYDYGKEIRTLGISQWIETMFVGLQDEKKAWDKKKTFQNFWGNIGNAFLSFVRDGAAYIVLIRMFAAAAIGIGDFVFLFGIISSFSSQLNSISGMLNKVIGSGIKIGYYREYFEIEDVFNHSEGCKFSNMQDEPVRIQFQGVSYSYTSESEKKYALCDINLSIKAGEKLAIVGKNGAGKTTLVKLLCGLYSPTEGKILINGVDIKAINIDRYYSLISVVFQDVYLFPVTIKQFIASRYEGINAQKVMYLIEQVGLKEKIDSLPNGINTHLVKGVFDDSTDFSGGEKQKLMLARAMYKDAGILVLDEPTAALDPIAENEIYSQYDQMTHGKTALYISHRLASTRFCDRILYMESGKILEEGSHEELLRLGGKYAAMYAAQSRYYKEEGVQVEQ